jgi:hypothetical protein
MPKIRSLLTPLALGGLVGAAAGAALHFASPQTTEKSALTRLDFGSASQATEAARNAASRLDDGSVGSSAPYAARVAAALRDAGPDAVLDTLETLADPLVARAAALEIAAALGYGADDIERVAQHLQPGARLGFRAEAYARWAARDASTALAAAIAASANPSEQSMLLQRIALELSRNAPEASWRVAAEIADGSQRGAFRAAVLAEWALVGPEAALDFLERVDATELPANLEIPSRLIATDPERVLAASVRLGLRLRVDTRRQALETLAASDPERAFDLLGALIPESERSPLLASLARGYGAHDPARAFAWAEAHADAGMLLPAVVSGVATVDFTRALAVIADGVAAGRDEAFAWASSVIRDGLSPDDARRLLDALAANPRPESAYRINGALYRWAENDARSAVDWFLANRDKVPDEIAESVAEIVARTDAELALSVAARLKPEQRGNWVVHAVRTAANDDLGRAVALLEPFRGEPFFAEAARTIALARSLDDPAGAARMLAGAGAEATREGATVANAWAARDPDAAAAWVARWPMGEARLEAIRLMALTWAERDLDAGIARALGLPRAERDAALTGLAESAARIGIADARIFDGFASDEAKLTAAERAVTSLAYLHPGRARRLVESIATDPAHRDALETALARALMRRFVP